MFIGTQKGADLLCEDYEKIKPKGKGSLLHQAGQYLVCEFLGASTQKVFVEYGKADIAEVFDNGRLRGYELELHPESGDIVNQVLNDFQAGFSEVVVLTVNKEGPERVKKRVYEKFKAEGNLSEKLSQIKFALLKDYSDV